jgi:hypothetical protein
MGKGRVGGRDGGKSASAILQADSVGKKQMEVETEQFER